MAFVNVRPRILALQSSVAFEGQKLESPEPEKVLSAVLPGIVRPLPMPPEHDGLLAKGCFQLAKGFNALFKPLRRLERCSTLAVETTQHQVQIPNLPEAFEGIRILHLSDTQFFEHSSPELVARLQQLIWEEAADLIVLTGDVVDAGARQFEMAKDFLSQLQASLGKYACLGNHDYMDGKQGNGVVQVLKASGFVPLVNSVFYLQKEGVCLQLSGLDDFLLGVPDLADTFAQIDPQWPHIALVHNPDHFPEVAQHPHRPELMLSGHTHNGHFRSQNLMLDKLLDRLRGKLIGMHFDYPAGWFTQNGTQLYVSRGTSEAWFAFFNRAVHFPMPALRLNNPPEIAVHTLTVQARTELM